MDKITKNDALISTILSINNRASKIFNSIVNDTEIGIEKQCLSSERMYCKTYYKIDKLLLNELEDRLFNYKNELEGMRRFDVDLAIEYDGLETMKNMQFNNGDVKIEKQYYKVTINISW